VDVTATRLAFHEIERIKDQLYKENVAFKEEIDESSMFEEIVGTSKPLRRVLEHVKKVGATESTVLISGETGTGKELIARAIHKQSPRADRPFIRVTCAAIPQSLVASELFGHEKGAFTGATQLRHGGSKWPMVAHCSSTKLASCRPIRRFHYCEFYRKGKSSGLAARKSSRRCPHHRRQQSRLEIRY